MGVPPMTVDQKQEVTELVEDKMRTFQYDVQNMVNNFHIEIIRQFEIQKTSMETLVQDYLLDDDDNTVFMQGQGGDSAMAMLEPDLAEGDDIVFFDKYGDQGQYDRDELSDDEFDNGYYF